MNNLEKVLEYALSRPPSSAGLRLRSERDLAALLETDHFKVRKSLSELVRRGVLVRRHGSGTYVRKVPKASQTYSSNTMKIPSESLFAADQLEQGYVPPLEPMKHQQQLHLGLWSDLEPEQMASRQALIGGISSQTKRAGHILSMHSISGDDGKMISVSELSKRLKGSPCDGYLVGSWSADMFLEAMGTDQKPIVYFSDSSRSVTHEPMVLLDSHEAIHRGVRLLGECGYGRIGLIGLEIPDDPGESTVPSLKEYERAIKDFGLAYHAADFAQANVNESMAATRRMLDRPEPPEAILVIDDIVLNGVAEALKADGILPGRDLAVIAVTNVSSKLPRGVDWSRLEFDAEALGERIVNTLLGLLQTAGMRANSSATYVKWRPGKTHLLRKGDSR